MRTPKLLVVLCLIVLNFFLSCSSDEEVAPNNAPIVANPMDNQTLEEGFGSITISLAGVFGDEDGDALSISAESNNTGVVSVSIVERELTITEVGIGLAGIDITADDGNGGMVTDEFEVMVEEVEEGDLVVIQVETETATLTSSWRLRTDIDGFTGDGYIVWEGEPLFWKGNPGGVAILTYEIEIPKAGTYLFNWRSHIAKGTESTEHNDSWLRLPDADAFYGEKSNGSRVYPTGSGNTPNPAGESGNGFFKVYMNTVNSWTFTSGTSDHDFHSIYATYDEPGIYTVEIAPRSDFHAIDSFRFTEQR